MHVILFLFDKRIKKIVFHLYKYIYKCQFRDKIPEMITTWIGTKPCESHFVVYFVDKRDGCLIKRWYVHCNAQHVDVSLVWRRYHCMTLMVLELGRIFIVLHLLITSVVKI